MLGSVLNNYKIGVIGLGNVGLPLAIEFGKKYKTKGYDIDKQRINSLIEEKKLNNFSSSIPLNLSFTHIIENLKTCDIYVIAVPTGLNFDKSPNLEALITASQSVAKLLNSNDIVIYESTVFPGCTENICVPILVGTSGLRFNLDFFVGYSPERINTVDPVNTLTNTIKVTAGSDFDTAQIVDELYKTIIDVGTYKVSSIKVAEASKILENAQRDVNIAFMNNAAAILGANNISFEEVWNASSSKWNFIPFKTGLVGGECLALASHYLNHLSNQPENILTVSRKINEELPKNIANLVISKLNKVFPLVLNPSILILGISYKPNTSNIKGSLVPALIDALKVSEVQIDVYDPIAEQSSICVLKELDRTKKYHLVIRATNHLIFNAKESDLFYNNFNCLFFDVNSMSF